MKWVLKIATKIVLARLPIPYGFWKLYGIFQHGSMDRADYALKIFRLHMLRAYQEGMLNGATVLELGPGDSIGSAIIAAAHGAQQVWLIDVGNFATKDIVIYKALAHKLAQQGLPVPDLSGENTFGDILRACNAHYLTDGLQSLRELSDDTVDFTWSHSVLEHVRKHELADTLQELYRVMKPGARASHNIDYQDHLDHSLNNLRFSEQLWESPLFMNSGFYTNRVSATLLHDLFRRYSFTVLDEEFGHWPQLPIPRRAIHQDFQNYTDDQLNCRTSSVFLSK